MPGVLLKLLLKQPFPLSCLWKKYIHPNRKEERDAVFTSLYYLFVFQLVTSMSPVLGLQNPAAQAWSSWLRTQ